ncbi:VCBS domain-containing protein [Mesorhizobium sp. B2-8-3]|uniref:beta strand repeat-containing protein n=1 Tax=Mesorhizobium sp. B2-8-3 TaxID=2589905 RepID=UPI001AED2E79|nr:VCBS domain-containing protein [Mesorhizobium sp. B2-8-3]
MTITITGTNDSPVITTAVGQDAGTVVEAGNLDNGTVVPGTPSASGTLTSSDVDHLATATWSGDATGTYGAFAINPTTGAWTFALDQGAADHLAEGESDTQTFTATVTDDKGATATETVTITITGTNDSPVANADTGAVLEDATLTVSAANGVIRGTTGGSVADTDVDNANNTLVVSGVVAGTGTVTQGVGVGSSLAGTYGHLTLNADGSYSYLADNANSLAAGVTAVDIFTYTDKDPFNAVSNTTTLQISVTGTNENPTVTAGAQSVQLVEAGVGTAGTASASIALTKGDVDAGDAAVYDGTALTTNGWATSNGGVTYTKTGTYGIATLTTSTGIVSYALDNADTDTNGLAQGAGVSDNFTVFVKDGSTGTASTAVNFAITGTNDAPDIHIVLTGAPDSAAPALNETNAGLSTSGTLTVNDPDIADTVSSSVTTVVASGAITGLGLTTAQLLAMLSVTPTSSLAADPADTHNLSWTFNSGTQAFNYLAAGQSLVLTYTVQSTDNHAVSDIQAVTVTVNGTNDAPVTAADLVITSAGNNQSFDIPEWALVANDTDPDNPTLDVLFGSVGSATSGTTSHTPGTGNNGFVRFTDDTNAAGSFQYQVTDGTASGPVATVTIDNRGSSGNAIVGTSAGEIMIGTGNKDNFDGAAGNDIIIGKAGGGTYIGGSGNDIIVYQVGVNGGSGQVVIHGDAAAAAAGTDSDTLKLIQTTPATINLANANQTSASNTTVDGMENVDASLSSGAMTLTGSSGANVLIGGSAGDTIAGGLGADIMTGGGGADTFVINSAQSLATIGGSGDAGTVTGYDVVTDFDGAADFLDLQGASPATLFAVANTGGTDGADSTLTVDGQTVKSHAITNGIVTFDDADIYGAAISLDGTDTSRVAAVVQYLKNNDIGNAGATVAFSATINGVAHTYVYEQVGPTQNVANDILIDLSGVTLTSGGTSLQTLITNTHVKPAGVAGESINLALTDPSADPNDLIKLEVTGVPSGWSLNAGTNNGDGTWTVQTKDVRTLAVTSSTGFVGAVVLNIAETWTGADGNTGAKLVSDNVEAYAHGSPIFAWSGDDVLSGSSGSDLFVFSQPIGNDTVHSFDAAADQIDLIGYSGIANFADVQAHMADDSNGNAVISLGAGQSIMLDGVHSSALTGSNFAFDQTPVVNNAGTMTIGDGALLPLSGTVNNTGLISLDSTGSDTLLQLIQHGITLQGGGQIALSDSDANIVSGTAADVTLTNVDNTISGAGQLGGGLLGLNNQGTIIATGTHALVIDTGGSTVSNSGTLEATGSGGLTVNGAVANSGLIWANGGDIAIGGQVTGDGDAIIGNMSQLEFHAASSTNVTFAADAAGTLQLDDSFDFSGSIAGITNDDKVDLGDILFGTGTSAVYHVNQDGSGGTLLVSDGTHDATLHIIGAYDADSFTVADDGTGRTVVGYHPADEFHFV